VRLAVGYVYARSSIVFFLSAVALSVFVSLLIVWGGFKSYFRRVIFPSGLFAPRLLFFLLSEVSDPRACVYAFDGPPREHGTWCHDPPMNRAVFQVGPEQWRRRWNRVSCLLQKHSPLAPHLPCETARLVRPPVQRFPLKPNSSSFSRTSHLASLDSLPRPCRT
jgi:hypothetical protein